MEEKKYLRRGYSPAGVSLNVHLPQPQLRKLCESGDGEALVSYQIMKPSTVVAGRMLKILKVSAIKIIN